MKPTRSYMSLCCDAHAAKGGEGLGKWRCRKCGRKCKVRVVLHQKTKRT